MTISEWVGFPIRLGLLIVSGVMAIPIIVISFSIRPAGFQDFGKDIETFLFHGVDS